MAHENIPPTGEPASDHITDTVVVQRADDETPATSVVEAVAAVTDTPPTELRPASKVIDTDALNRLCGPESTSSDGSVSFQYEACDVTVHADGRTVVSPPAETES